MLSFPVSPINGQRFQGWTWDGVKWAPTKLDRAPRCGRFLVNGASPSTSVRFVPYNGDEIKINGLIYRIPSAGIVATQGSLYLNKVAGSSLTLSVAYFVYVFFDGAALQLNFSTTGHATSTTAGNVGTEIRSGDDSQTLIGIVLPGGTPPVIFYDRVQNRYIRSWFNRPRAVLVESASFASSATTPSVAIGVNWIGFSDDSFIANGIWNGTTIGNTNLNLQLRMNGNPFGANVAISSPYTEGQYVAPKAHGVGGVLEAINSLALYIWGDYASTFNGNYALFATVAGPK